jgi:hypothetical protein
MIIAPEPFDVLCGKGKPIQKHPGNKLLRLLIDQNCHRYNKAPRLERRAISNEIVHGIKSNHGKLPGRFLRLCAGSATEQEGCSWMEVRDAVAIDKVSHCFRARRNLAPEILSSSCSGGGSLVSMINTSAAVVSSSDDDISFQKRCAGSSPPPPGMVHHQDGFLANAANDVYYLSHQQQQDSTSSRTGSLQW